MAAFTNASTAQAAAAVVRAAGTDPESITVTGAGAVQPSNEPQREAGFIWRLVLIVVGWSMIGVFIGAVIGVALAAAGVPPSGRYGVVVQIIVWGLFFHIMAGLWAGYALLTKGESRRPVTRASDGRVLLSIACEPEQAATVAESLRRSGSTSVAAYSADGKLIG